MDIRMDERLWSTSMAPEGLLERWRVADGATVGKGEAIAEVRIEECLHDVMSPGPGQLGQVIPVGGLVEPGTLIATLEG